ncbi:hypothetical protein COL26_33940 [Bacillus thuringiensis]|uniref:DUF418 domain-containing protein n=1 Tax=Bacillus thuringiensis TaxID=1428 RepID=A0ABD6RUZ1_BACTU|nr:DUF418 domain-containing protein [Bacillus thuringiensis]PER37388.1 hypothetical protein CN495_34965 [Bacillus thuringiensis]PEU67283.1 hypothetical protein CN411_34855 [Bacillus thuringiensis]PFI06407.1 hypothetical protein COI79_22035 [Bacillus thuringiensis]PFW18136.1 hypothetical protein COL26_33940 [Bacillus thuringiensis]PGY58668.1 hypothetical protein COE44_34355 [Bacillus thuringiensis]
MIQKQRIEIVDYLRGFALIGITFTNIFQHTNTVSTDANPYFSSFIQSFMVSKIILIFMFLLGLSSALFMSNLKKRGEKANLIYIRRFSTLLLIGVTCTFVGVPAGGLFIMYAIYGLIGFVFQYIPPMINIVIFIAIAILTWFTRDMFLIEGESTNNQIVSLLNMLSGFSMIILGIFLGQVSFFNHLQRCKGLLATSAALLFFLTYYSYGWMNNFNSLVMSLFYIVCFTILSMIPMIRSIFSFLIAFGRMSMSNYIVHTSIVYYYLENGKFSFLIYLGIGLSIIVIQIIYSNIWLKHFRMGPLEWIWRMGIYWKKVRIVGSFAKDSNFKENKTC